MNTRIRPRILALLLCCLPFAAQAQQSILDHQAFPSLQATLVSVITDTVPNAAGTHHFFVTRYAHSGDTAYMFWKEGKKLWTFTVPANTAGHDVWHPVRYPRAASFLDLDTDVVDTTADVGTSTYLAPKQWIYERLYDAAINGDVLIITIE